MLSNSVCMKSVTFDHIIQNEKGPESWYNFIRRKHKQNKNVTMSLASTSLSQFLRINASLIFKLQYNRECRRGREVKNICPFSFFNYFSFKGSEKNLQALVVDDISLISIFIDISNGDLAVDDEICLGNRISISSREHSALRWRLLNHQH